MKLYYSATTGEFYDSCVHQTLPDDAVKIGDPDTILATRKYVDDTVQKNRGEIEHTVKEKYAGLRNMQVFDKDGEFTVPENCTRIKIRVWGGGGSGSAGTNGFRSMSGAGGGYAEGFFPVVPGTTLTVTVGAAGKASVAAGETGGSSAVSSLISATGGEGGRIEGDRTLGGAGQGGDWQVAGSRGQWSHAPEDWYVEGTWQLSYCDIGGSGGSAYGSSGGLGDLEKGPRGRAPGSGGAGGGKWEGQYYPGGDGGDGLVIIEY